MNRFSLLFDRFRESRLAVAFTGGGLAVILFGVLLFATSHGKPTANANENAYDGVSQTTQPPATTPGQRPNAAINTASTTTTTAPDPTPNPKSLPEEIPEEFDTQITETTLGPDGKAPAQEGTATEPLSGPTTAVAIDVATKFVQEWGNTNRSRSAWVAGMGQYTTQTFIDDYEGVEPADLPTVKVTGAATVLSNKNPIEIQIPTDHGNMLVTISSVQLSSGFVKVIDVQPETDNGSFVPTD